MDSVLQPVNKVSGLWEEVMGASMSLSLGTILDIIRSCLGAVGCLLCFLVVVKKDRIPREVFLKKDTSRSL